MADNNTSKPNLLQAIIFITLLAGASGSLYFMFKAASNQKSIILMVLFTVWVLSPFVALFIANKVAFIKTVITPQLLYWLIPVVTIVSLIAYSGLITIAGTKTAFIFLVFPFVSWVFILVIFLIAKLRK